jgi:hypothetical protein
MLVDENYADILPLFREFVESLFDRRLLCLIIDDEKVALRVRRLCNVAYASEEETSDGAGSH